MARPAPQPAPVSGESSPGFVAGTTVMLSHTHSLEAALGEQRLALTQWALASGDAAYATGTALGTPTHREHGLLVARTLDPAGAVSLIQQMHETITIGKAFDDGGTGAGTGSRRCGSALQLTQPLTPFAYCGGVGGLAGVKSPGLVRFERSRVGALWQYNVGGAEVTKEVRMGFRQPCVVVRYAVRSRDAVRLEVRPLVSIRPVDALIGEADQMRWSVKESARGCSVMARLWDIRDEDVPEGGAMHNEQECAVNIAGDGGRFVPGGQVLRSVQYLHEKGWGVDGGDQWEDLFAPGTFVVEHAGGEEHSVMTIAASVAPAMADPANFDSRVAQNYMQATCARTVRLHPGLEGCGPLILAGDAFVRHTPRDRKQPSWITPCLPLSEQCARQTMMCVPGLLLTTGRRGEAKLTLDAASGQFSRGMLASCVDAVTGEAVYDNVDGALWFVHACGAYLQETQDEETYYERFFMLCKQVVEYLQTGTHHGTVMDKEDGLLVCGSEDMPVNWLRWMKHASHMVRTTGDDFEAGVCEEPVRGKAVEVNALWYNALLIMANVSEGREPDRASRYRALAKHVREGFVRRFWDADRSALHDLVVPVGRGEWAATGGVRANQVFAVSLPHSPLSKAQKRGVVVELNGQLLTGCGLRTLSPVCEGYVGRAVEHGAELLAGHNGGAWPWLIGPYAECLLRFGEFSTVAREHARHVLEPVFRLVAGGGGSVGGGASGGCLGHIAEFYDGDEPRRAHGRPAHALAIAELTRVAALAGGW